MSYNENVTRAKQSNEFLLMKQSREVSNRNHLARQNTRSCAETWGGAAAAVT